ncbi:MAG: MlaE family lipid ABC transporter permease subunit [Candidatus Hatepunaea meridiana]|nr:MlaE family lipid ABC transporter permease subunit [Candidatus Hatepunaea meridiana]
MARKDINQSFKVEDNGKICILADLRRGGPPRMLEGLTEAVKAIEGDRIEIDLSELDKMDSLGASLLAELAVRSRVMSKNINFTGISENVEKGLARYYFPSPSVRLPKKFYSYVEALGQKIVNFWEDAGDLLLLVSETVYWSVVTLWRGDGHRKGGIEAQALSIGVGALPVVALIAFLIGLILALQSAEQLRQFGANIYVADLVAISMTTEMGPLMTAILLAGRSGSAIAAEIATMQVNEEIDALRVMGLNPIRYVVVPKVWGILITAPLLSIMSVVIGITGGLIIAVTSLDLTPRAYFLEAATSLFLIDIIAGFVKSLVFAFLIVILAAYFGFRVKGGPEGVGRVTTASVVASIFAVIMADAALGLLFYM